MATIAIDEAGVARSLEGVSGGQQRCHSGEALAEWRSCEQLENGIPSTSPPYWDSDDEDGGPKPSELYGKYTWKIDKFSQINKRELRSNAFEVGGYKWYILIYPQGCDVCNHLSLFLCVANHDKLLPGWSHFAQFTIAIVNKDPKKSKYSDTLHRFWKKEHDWGWKKFMELSKVLDGFIDADTLIIKAQVQVIRERADRPFRCLDCQYRRELVRVYLTNVEQICRRFVEERRSKLGKLIEDKARWSSFCSFWMGMEQISKRRMSREKIDSILKVIVKHFFIEKEVTSTLVMDSLYSGLKALEGQTKGKKDKGRTADSEELAVPIVRMEEDMFVLVDDVLLLLERATLEPLPPKDDKGPQNRTKDGCSGDDFNKDSIERDERRLTALGRRTIEIFVLAHIFSSKIEVAYQEAVALKRQEELIREEEAAWMAETEHKAKRGADKEKKSKKTKGKQKRNNRKAKDKVRDDKANVTLQNKAEQDSLADVMKDYTEEEDGILEKLENTVEDVSDVSDSVDCAPDVLRPDSEDRDTSAVNWDTDTSEVHVLVEARSSEVSGLSSVQNGAVRRSTSLMDDSSSTCSSDSVPSAINSSFKRNSTPIKNQKSATRRIEQSGANCELSNWSHETSSQPLEVTSAWLASGNCKTADRSHVTVDSSDPTKWLKQKQLKKEKQQLKKDEEASPPKQLGAKNETEVEQLPSESRSVVQSPPRGLKKTSSTADLSSDTRINATGSPVKKQQSESPKQADGSSQSPNSAAASVPLKPSGYTRLAPNSTENLPSQLVHLGMENSSTQLPMMSRPLSAPIIPGPKPAPPVISLVQTPPLLSRSVSAAGRLGPEPSTAAHSYVPKSYRNVMMGSHVAGGAVSFTQPHSPSSGVNTLHSHELSAAFLAKPFFLPQSSERVEPNVKKPSFSFGMLNPDVLANGQMWNEGLQGDVSASIPCLSLSGLRSFEEYKPKNSRSLDRQQSEFPPCTSGRQIPGGLTDEFPHLDIINDLLDDEQVMGRTATTNSRFHSYSIHHLNRQFSFPGDVGISGNIGLSSDMDTSTSCRFERTRSYHEDGFHQSSHGFSGGPYDIRPYSNGHMDGLMPNQWPMAVSDRSYISTRNIEGEIYPYQHIPDYLNMESGGNSYAAFRPSNGH